MNQSTSMNYSERPATNLRVKIIPENNIVLQNEFKTIYIIHLKFVYFYIPQLANIDAYWKWLVK
jgi:hypothetical protein